MESRGREYKVGVFVTIGLFLLMATIVILGGTKNLFGKHYTLTLNLPSVEGLGPGSVVQVAGLKVGNVDSVTFSEKDSQLKVTMKIETEYQSRITEGSTGSLRTQGALGDKFVFIEPGPPTARPLKDGEVLSTASGGDLFSALAAKGPEFEKIFAIINEVHKLVSSFNAEGRSNRIAKNLADGTDDLKGAMDKLNHILKSLEEKNGNGNQIQKSLTHLSSILEKVDRGQGTLGALINDSSVFDRLKEFTGGNKRDKYLKNVIRDTIQKEKDR